MSVEVISHVMRLDIPDGVAKLVAFVLADYAHAETGQAWPKLETLARKCSQSTRTVQRKIRLLQDMKVLKVHRQESSTGRQRENLYVFRLPWVDETGGGDAGSGPDHAPVQTGPQRGDRQSPVLADSVTPMGDKVVTPEGDTAVTPRGIHQKESVKGESPKREIPDVAPSPRARMRERAPEGAPPLRATLCPDDFDPKGRHYAAAEAAGRDRGFVLEAADRMHRWSHANAHRPIARKADWDLTFDGFLETVIQEAATRSARQRPGRAANGAIGPYVRRAEAAGGHKVPDDVREARNTTAMQMAARGEWPIGAKVFVARDEDAGRAWEEHFLRFGTQPRWMPLDKGFGAFMPAPWPPAVPGAQHGA